MWLFLDIQYTVYIELCCGVYVGFSIGQAKPCHTIIGFCEVCSNYFCNIDFKLNRDILGEITEPSRPGFSKTLV